MGAISNSKTWTKIYRTVAGGAGTASYKTLMRTLKDDLKTAGFTHISSCDAASTSTSTDLWDADADLTWATAGTNHSWMVLAHSSIVSTLQICIDLNFSTGYNATILASVSSGFSGGNTANRPTAADEIVINVNDLYGAHATSANSKQYNMFYSSDGESIRIYTAYSGTTNYGYWGFDKIQNAPSWVTYPITLKVGTVITSSANLKGDFAYMYFPVQGRITVAYGAVVIGTSTIQDLASLDSGDYNTDWPASRLVVISNTSFVSGIFGYISDMWRVIDNLADFDYFPGNGSKAQVVISDIAQGSDASTVSW
jgi:hypothetical protein